MYMCKGITETQNYFPLVFHLITLANPEPSCPSPPVISTLGGLPA